MLERVLLMAGSSISARILCSSVRVVIGFLVTSLTKVLHARLLRLVRQPALGRVWVVAGFSISQWWRPPCVLGNFQHSRKGFILFTRYSICLITILSRRPTDSSVDSIV
jgi:hypothetical protein